MTLEKVLIVLLLAISFKGVAQKLELHFEQAVELSNQIDYTVNFEYFDHREKITKNEFIFLKNKQSVTHNFDQDFPVEVEVSFTFKKSTHRFPLLLRPGNTLEININQAVKENVKLLEHQDFFNDYFIIKGKDANLNKLMISHQHLIKVDNYIYSKFYRNKYSEDKTVLRKKFIGITESQINNFDKKIESLDFNDNKDAVYFKHYMKDKHRLQVAYNALNSIQNNGRKYGIDSLNYYQFIDYLFDLNGNNHHIKEYYFRSNQIRLYNDEISSRYLYASTVPFEAYMNSDAFQVRREWDSIYQNIKSSEGSTLSNVILKIQELKGPRPVDWEVRSVMMNDLYYNGVVFHNYYRDSLFIDYLSTLGLSSNLKLNILLSRLGSLETDGLRDISRHTNSASILPYKMSKVRRNLYLKAFKTYDRKEYEGNLNFHFNTIRKLTEDESYADSIKIVNSDLELYNFALPDPSQVTVLVNFSETYYYSLAFKLSFMKELKKQFGSRLNLVVLIDWGRRESKHIVNRIMQAIEDENIPVKACIMKSHLSTYYYNKGNLRFPSDFFVITQDGLLPIIKPKKSGYFSFKLSERMALDRAYFGEGSESPAMRYKPKQHEEHTGVDADSNKYVLSVAEDIEVLLNSELNYLKNDFDVFLDSAFADGKGWYSIENNGSMVLSKNKFQTVYSSKPVRWQIYLNQTRLHIFDDDRSVARIDKDIQIDKENGVLFIDGSDYKILFYDEEYIILATPERE